MFVKNGLSGEHYNFKRCEYLLKFNNEVKQYVQSTIVKSH